MILTSTWRVSFPPTLSKDFSCKTLRSFTCILNGISVISSRKRVPLSAISKRPNFLATAPVKAPFSCPNSSLSRRFSGRAAQFTGTKGLSHLGLFLCMATAATSLPVPLSPVISTVALLLETFSIKYSTSFIEELSPIIFQYFLVSSDRRKLTSLTSWLITRFCLITIFNSSRSKGLVR